MPKAECFRILQVSPVYEAPTFAEIDINIAGAQRPVMLWYDETGGTYYSRRHPGLLRIRSVLYRSQMFFDPDLGGEDIYVVMDRVREQYQGKYAGLIEAYTKQLGEPAFSGYSLVPGQESGTWMRNPAFPEEEWGWLLTYWLQPEGRLQARLNQEDKELPFTIDIASSLIFDHQLNG
jgi:hypothetical protein